MDITEIAVRVPIEDLDLSKRHQDAVDEYLEAALKKRGIRFIRTTVPMRGTIIPGSRRGAWLVGCVVELTDAYFFLKATGNDNREEDPDSLA